MLQRLITKWLCPEVALFQDGEQRRTALNTAWRSVPTARKLGGFAIVSGLLLPPVFYLTTQIARSPGIGAFVVGVLAGLLYVLASIAIITLFIRKHLQRSLRTQLNSLGKPTCVACAYDLTGNVSGKCSECGDSI